MPTLYHYTCTRHLPTILKSGRLLTTESNVSLLEDRVGEDVVWLTTDPSPRPGQQGLGDLGRPPAHDKTRVRFEVTAADAEPWIDSRVCEQMSEWERRALIRAGGGRRFAETWWVAYGPIPRANWVDLRVDGQTHAMRLPGAAFGL